MRPSPRRQPRGASPARQRGVIAMIVAVLLVTGVVFVLAQSLDIIGTRSVDTSRQQDSTAALALAESGLQRAEAVLGSAATSVTDASCTALSDGPYALGRGSFTYASPIVSPPTCGATGGVPCDTCQVTVTGQVGTITRTLSQGYIFGLSYGTTGRGTTVTMVLKNTYDVPAVSLFNMAWKRQDPGGNADATFCANGATGCGLRWNEESSNGNTSVGGMGVTVEIAPLTLSKVVVQTISQARDYVEVGGLFPSTSTTSTPTVSGTFWDDKHVAHLTALNAGTTGGVIAGAATTTGTCTASPTTYPPGGTGSFQADTCTNWCSAADTLVFGVSGRSATTADQMTAVTFGTNGTAPNVPLTKLVHYPNTDGSTPNASGKAYSEIWYAYNPPYTLAAGGAGATSYTTAALATAGASPVLTANLSNHDTTMTVASLADPNSRICVGDVLSGDADINGAVITSTPGGTCGTTGIYAFSPQAGGQVNKNNVVVSSTRLRVQSLTGSAFSAGATNSGVSIASGPDGSGNYTLSSAANFATSYVTQGANSTTIRVPSGGTLPSVGTRVAVQTLGSSPAGAGALASSSNGTIVQSVGTDSFTVGSVPTTALVGVTGLCGGTCAFFNTPADAAAITNFSVAKSSGTSQFAGGFVCLRGVDGSRIVPVTATSLKTGRWEETVQ